MVVHTFDPSARATEVEGSLEFEANQVYTASPRITGTTWRDPIQKKKMKKCLVGKNTRYFVVLLVFGTGSHWAMVVHTFNPSAQRSRQMDL